MRIGQFEPPEQLNKSEHAASAHQLCPGFQSDHPGTGFTLHHVLHVRIRTRGSISPHLAPINGQEEEIDGVGSNSEVISNCSTNIELPEATTMVCVIRTKRIPVLLTDNQLKAAGTQFSSGDRFVE